ncbi:MAG TPA: TonB-dependent receptor [Edaphobacter sp.]|nr:TonB-dependent receptor [Edaphobacter sp.]
MKKFLLTVVCLVVALTYALPGSAQEFRGTISGKITDSSGAVIPNATIVAVGPTHTYNAKSGSGGGFTIPFVQPANYDVTITAAGFKSELRPRVLIDINTRINLNVALQVGETTQTVTVTSSAGLTLNTEDASGGTIMDPEKVQNLPLNGRQAYMLLSLTPGTQFTQTQFGASGYSGTRGWDESNAYSINGQSGSFNQFSLNGAPVSQQNGGGSGTWNIAPNIDAIDEFKVMTNTYDAQYGRFAGGTVNTVLKSGTRHFHGTAFDFWRNSVLDSNTFTLNQQNAKKPFHNEHQFGGTIGGPIWKDKAFFFFSFEGWREVLPGSMVTTVPALDMYPDANGNVNLTNYLAANGKGGIYDPATVHCIVAGQSPCAEYERDQFPNNTIPGNRISPIALKIMNLFPKPSLQGYTNNYVYNGSNPYKYNQPMGSIDYNFSDRTRLSGTFAWWSGLEYRNGNGFSGPAVNGNINNYRSSLTQTIDLTHTFTQNLFADVRLSFNRAWNRGPNGALSAGLAKLTPGDLGLSMPAIPTTSHNYAPEIAIEGYSRLMGNTGDPNIFETYALTPSLTYVIRRHTLHFGADVMLFHDVSGGIGQPNGQFNFGTGYTWQYPKNGNSTGGGIADLLLGYPDGGDVQENSSPYESYNAYGAFIQDDWKILPKLTLNLGIRWDTETSPVDRNNHLAAGLCLTCVNSSLSSIPGGTLPNGGSMVSPILGTARFASSSLTAYENTIGTFQPKFGFNYAIRNDLVMRGGWGLGTALGIELGGASPWQQQTNYNAQSNSDNWTPTESFNQGNPFPNGFTPYPANTKGDLTFVGDGLGIDQRDRKIPVVQSYSFGFQGELPLHIIGDLEYVGTHTIDIRTSRQLDGLSNADVEKGLANADYLDQQVPNPFYGVLPATVGLGQNPTVSASTLMVPYPQFNRSLYVYTHADGYQNYNSLIAKAEKRISNGGSLSKGLSFLASFTWAKLMVANGYLNNGGAFKVDDKPVYHMDGGNSTPTASLSFSGLYGLPFGRGARYGANTHGIVSEAISDWQFDWIFQNRTGTPIGIPTGDIYTCGQYDVRSAHKNYKSWVNNSQESCWSHTPEYFIYTFDGTQTKVRQPWSQQTQLAISKQFIIREGTSLKFKAEAFNATNTPIFGGPDMGSPEDAPTRVTSVADPNQPGAWRGYGTVGSAQQNFPRQYQLSLKLQF